MGIYDSVNIGEILKNNSYAGRGIVAGLTGDGKKAAAAYFIMGRSENSRNRIFVEEGEDLVIYPFDETKVEDPSLIIYKPVRKLGDDLIVTNGDQTDTVYDFLKEGKCFGQALATREFEPDAPNLTPRISALLHTAGGKLTYEMSILKSVDAVGSGCARYFWNYPGTAGLGHFIHTYESDGNPLPTFRGEPRRVKVPDTADAFLSEIWENLNADNRISLYVRYVELSTGKSDSRLINKNR